MARLHLVAFALGALFAAVHAVPAGSKGVAKDDPACKISDCPADGTTSLVASKCTCQDFFECAADGTATHKACLPWENFDHLTGTCLLWDMVDCSRNGEIKPVDPVVKGCAFRPECPETGKANLGVPCKDSCGIYVACSEGQWEVKKCSWNAPWFDSKSGKCKLIGAKCTEV